MATPMIFCPRFVSLLFAALLWVTGSLAATPVRIGVLAWQGHEEAEIHWASLIQQLQKRLPGRQIVLQHYDLAGMRQALNAEQLDFVVTNPGHYISLEADSGITRIATQIASQASNPGHVVGSSVIVRAERAELQTLADLRGRKLAAVSPDAFGGYQVIWAELKTFKLDPERGDLTPVFTGFPMQNVVDSVVNGQADAAVLRACLLEQLEAQGKLPAGLLRVISPINEATDCRVSSRLYPGWAFAAAHNTPSAMSRDVLLALLSMRPDENGLSWTVPADYHPVHELLRSLQIGPYTFLRETGWDAFWHRYWPWLGGIFIILLAWGAYTLHVEHLVQRRTRELLSSQAERHELEERIQATQEQMDHLSRLSILGELSSTLAHELNQPLAAISNYARSLLRRQENGKLSPEALLQATEEIANESERAAAILSGIRAFARKRTHVRERCDLAKLIDETAHLMANMQTRPPAIELHHQLALDARSVEAAPLQIQQVLLNLFKNAWDAQQSQQIDTPLEVYLSAEGQGCKVAIRDHGPGLPTESRDRLFEPFFTTKADGLGLGLSICKTIIEAHGGSLQAEDAQPGPGMLFHFTLPLASPAPTA